MGVGKENTLNTSLKEKIFSSIAVASVIVPDTNHTASLVSVMKLLVIAFEASPDFELKTSLNFADSVLNHPSFSKLINELNAGEEITADSTNASEFNHDQRHLINSAIYILDGITDVDSSLKAEGKNTIPTLKFTNFIH